MRAVNPRDFTRDVHKTVDDRPLGAGMGWLCCLNRFPWLLESIEGWGRVGGFICRLRGRLTDAKVAELAGVEHLVLLSGRYGGVDQRVIHHYGFEMISVGDYVLSGGELPALTVIDAVALSCLVC